MEKIIWTKTILQAYNFINRINRVIDKQVVERSAMSHLCSYGFDDTIAITESVIDLIERKRGLLALKYLVEDSIQFLERDLQKVLVLFFIDRRTISEIGETLKVSKRTINRNINRALGKCYFQFEKSGFSVEALKKRYSKEPWIVGMFNDNVKKSKGRKKVCFIGNANKSRNSHNRLNSVYSVSVQPY